MDSYDGEFAFSVEYARTLSIPVRVIGAIAYEELVEPFPTYPGQSTVNLVGAEVGAGYEFELAEGLFAAPSAGVSVSRLRYGAEEVEPQFLNSGEDRNGVGAWFGLQAGYHVTERWSLHLNTRHQKTKLRGKGFENYYTTYRSTTFSAGIGVTF